MDTEPILLMEQDMSEPSLHRLACGTVALFSARCPQKETPNEDAIAVIPLGTDSVVLAVADGMGGGAVGEAASAIAVKTLAQGLIEAGNDDVQQVRFAILNAIERANDRILQLGVGAATTLAVVEVRPEWIRPYHVGDSLILVTGNRGKIKLRTVPHSPVGYAVEAGLIDEKEAMNHEHRHLVSNVVGMPEMRIEVGAPLKPAPRDTLVLASDGLFDNLHPDEVVRHIRKGKQVVCARRLADEARSRMLKPIEGVPSKPDDLTFILFRPQRSTR